MGLTGKYDFKGIKDKGAKALLLSISAIPTVGVWFARLPFLRNIVGYFLELLVNLLANSGLMVLNIGEIIVGGAIDQAKFDKAMEDGLALVKLPGLTAAQKKAIDDEVVKAFRNFGLVTKHNLGVQGDYSDQRLRDFNKTPRI